MDFHRLRIFQAAARSLSFTVAAKDMSLSQPTVSLHIKQLEDELGCALFIRASKKLMLSSAGEVLLKYAERVFKEINHAELELQEFHTIKRGLIRLGVGASTLTYLLPPVLHSFRNRYPQIEIVISTEVTEVLLQRLLDSMLDFAVVMSPSELLSSVASVPLMEEELTIVLPESHPLCAKSVLLPRDLDGLPFLSHMRGTAMRTVQQELFDQLGIQPRIVMEMENLEAMKALVACGEGVAMMPKCCLRAANGRKLQGRSLHGARMKRDLLLASLDWRALPPAARRLAERIRRALSKSASDVIELPDVAD